MGSGVTLGGLKGLSINSKALTLSGDYNPDVKYPSVLTFPLDDIAFPMTIKSPTYNALFNLNHSFGTHKPPKSKTTFYKANNLTQTVKLHHLAPTPSSTNPSVPHP
jgi:hypothetical protein